MRIVLIRLRIVLDVISQVTEQRQHRQGDEVYVHRHLLFRYLCDDLVALFLGDALDPQRIHVVRCLPSVLAYRRCDGPRFLAERLVIGGKDPFALCQQFVILPYLRQSDGSVHIRHIRLHTHTHDVIAPTAGLALRKGILRLTVQRHHPQLLIQLQVVKGLRHVQTDGTALCRGDVLHGVQREDGDVGLRTRKLPAVVRADRVCRVIDHTDTTQLFHHR